MRRSVSMRGWLLVASVGALAMLNMSHAAAADFGFDVLKCFHPTGTYTGSTLGDEYKDPDGRTARNGHIDFKGGITGTPYSMDYVLHSKTDNGDKFLRVTPGADTAPTKPAAGCYMRSWWRTN